MCEKVVNKIINKKANLYDLDKISQQIRTIDAGIPRTPCLYNPQVNCRNQVWAITGLMLPRTYDLVLKMKMMSYSGLNVIVTGGYFVAVDPGHTFILDCTPRNSEQRCELRDRVLSLKEVRTALAIGNVEVNPGPLDFSDEQPK